MPAHLVLDAMGVIYRSGDDVAELLLPFVQQRSNASKDDIERYYHAASLGEITAEHFWQRVCLDSSVEDEYLQQHQLMADFYPFLQQIEGTVPTLWCLSNDLSVWSQKLRTRFGIADKFNGFVISGDIGLRKPDIRIYEKFLQISAIEPAKTVTVFVDDRPKNLAAASQAGLEPVLFSPRPQPHAERYRTVADFDQLARLLQTLA